MSETLSNRIERTERENIKLLQGNHDLGGMNQREKIGLWAESFEF